MPDAQGGPARSLTGASRSGALRVIAEEAAPTAVRARRAELLAFWGDPGSAGDGTRAVRVADGDVPVIGGSAMAHTGLHEHMSPSDTAYRVS